MRQQLIIEENFYDKNIFKDLLPGNKQPINATGNDAFYGEVPISEMIGGLDLASALNITEGVSLFPSVPWLKFGNQNKIFYVAKKPLRKYISWQAIYQAGAVYGDGTEGLYPSGTPVIQNATVEIDDIVYNVRLLKGADVDPVTFSEMNSLTSQSPDGEWARFIMRILSTYDGEWGTYSVEELGLDGSVNVSPWMQETPADLTETRLLVNGKDLAFFRASTEDESWRAWLPVLEPADIQPNLNVDSVFVLPSRTMAFNRKKRNLKLHDNETPGGIETDLPVTLKGPTSMGRGETVSYLITNYSDFSEYTVTANAGEVDITDDTITYTAPEEPGQIDLVVTRDGVSRVVGLEVTSNDLQGIYTQLDDAPRHFSQYVMIAVDGKMYVHGGYDGESLVNDLKYCDIETGEWGDLSDQYNLPANAVPKNQHSVVAIGKILYFFGTANHNASLTSYNIETGTWQALNSEPSLRNDHSAVVIDGKMYVFGGQYSSNELLRYDPENDAWATIDNAMANSPNELKDHTAVAIDGKMYVFGGTSSGVKRKNLMEYNPETNEWRNLSLGPSGRYNHSAVVINDKMYVFGGYTENGLGNDLWCYDPVTDVWAELPSGASVRYNLGAAAIDGKMYILAGLGLGNEQLTDFWMIE